MSKDIKLKSIVIKANSVDEILPALLIELEKQMAAMNKPKQRKRKRKNTVGSLIKSILSEC